MDKFNKMLKLKGELFIYFVRRIYYFKYVFIYLGLKYGELKYI